MNLGRGCKSPSGNTFDGTEPLESGTAPSFSPQPDARDCGRLNANPDDDDDDDDDDIAHVSNHCGNV